MRLSPLNFTPNIVLCGWLRKRWYWKTEIHQVFWLHWLRYTLVRSLWLMGLIYYVFSYETHQNMFGSATTAWQKIISDYSAVSFSTEFLHCESHFTVWLELIVVCPILCTIHQHSILYAEIWKGMWPTYVHLRHLGSEVESSAKIKMTSFCNNGLNAFSKHYITLECRHGRHAGLLISVKNCSSGF